MLVGLRLIENFPLEAFGHEFLVREVAGEIVGVLVAVGIAQILHQLGRCIAQMQGYGRNLVRFGGLQGGPDSHIGAVALRRRSQIDRGLRQGNASLRHADLVHDLEAGVGQQQGVGIGQADVLGRQDAQAPGDEERVLATGQHAGQPIDRRIRVRAPDTLDEGGNDVVMHLPAFVVDSNILLEAVSDGFVADDDLRLGELRVDHDFQDAQEFAPVAAAVAEEGVRLFDANLAVLQSLVGLQRPVQQDLQVGDFQGLEDKDLAAGEQGGDDLEGRVLRRRADQHDGAALDGAEQGVLLRLVEAVDLIDEEDRRRRTGEEGIAAGLVDHFAHLFHPGTDGAEGEELAVQGLGDDAGEGGLSDPGRAPEDEGRQGTGLDHAPQDAAFTDQVLLADILLQGSGPHPFRKRGKITGVGGIGVHRGLH